MNAELLDRRVLIIEPDPEIRDTLCSVLEDFGVGVDCAGDGISALYVLADRAPDAVLLDMDVAGVSSHRLYEVLRRDPETHDVPVVVLTADGVHSRPAVSRVVPAPEALLRKPAQPDDVAAEILRLLGVVAGPHTGALRVPAAA